MIIAIDGPAGSGKTSIAKILSKRSNIAYLDTGATYRAVTLKALQENIDLLDKDKLKQIAQNLNLRIDGEKIYLENLDVSGQIRSPRIDKNISIVVSFPEVREVMVKLQRAVAAGGDFVVEGRDITTVVFPDAEYKFFIDADFDLRAKRRFQELTAKGIAVEFEQVKNDLKIRDEADINRRFGPLKKSKDAVYIDTTNLNLEEVVNKIEECIRYKIRSTKSETK